MHNVPDGDRARRVLVVDDDDSIRDLVTTALTFVGFEVAEAASGQEALSVAPQFAADLIVLDVMMPGLDGFEVCRRLRADGDTTPVIFLTAKDASATCSTGSASAPTTTSPSRSTCRCWSPASRRCCAAALRPPAAAGEQLAYGGIELDERAHRVWRDGSLVRLSPTEFKLLRYLLLNAEHVLSKAQIVEHVWQYDFGGDPNVVETYMSYLRRKLGEPRIIQTVRGVGYVLRREP